MNGQRFPSGSDEVLFGQRLADKKALRPQLCVDLL